MWLIVFSDNHRDRSSVEWIVHENPLADRYLSLGDSEMKEHELSSMGIIGVKGNYPFEPAFPDELIFEFDGWRMFFTHGHKFFVKSGLTTLVRAAKARNCDVVLYGHTHQSLITKVDDVIVINPGSTSLPRTLRQKTYIRIRTDQMHLNIELREVFTNTLIEKIIYPAVRKDDLHGF